MSKQNNNNRMYGSDVMRSILVEDGEPLPGINEIVLSKLASTEGELKVEEILHHVGMVIKMEIDDSIRNEVASVFSNNENKKVEHVRHGYWKKL